MLQKSETQHHFFSAFSAEAAATEELTHRDIHINSPARRNPPICRMIRWSPRHPT
jgi:hypothetical protein